MTLSHPRCGKRDSTSGAASKSGESGGHQVPRQCACVAKACLVLASCSRVVPASERASERERKRERERERERAASVCHNIAARRRWAPHPCGAPIDRSAAADCRSRQSDKGTTHLPRFSLALPLTGALPRYASANAVHIRSDARTPSAGGHCTPAPRARTPSAGGHCTPAPRARTPAARAHFARE